MTRQEAIRQACSILSLAYHSVGNYDTPSDGFCDSCPAGRLGGEWHYQNAGGALDYVRAAVVAALKRDGHAIDGGFDAEGREKAKAIDGK